jgi:hypothetical protein
MSPLLLNRILRSPREVALDCRDDREVGSMAATSLAAITVGSLLFGAAAGSWRGATQALLAAGKLPVVMLATFALTAPAFYAAAAAVGRPATARSVLSLMLASGARLSLVLLASAPVIWLAGNLGGSYDLVKILASIAYGLGGIAALSLLVRGVEEGPGRRSTLAVVIGVFLLVGAQTAWSLRPYIGTPEDRTVPLFTRVHEGGLAFQLYDSVRRVSRGRAR